MARIAVLDDYQQIAAKMADWSGLQGAHEVKFFHQHLGDTDAVARALSPYDVIAIMRERTRISADLIAKLPNLKMIASTAMRNAAIDMQAAAARGIVVCGTGGGSTATPELAIGLMLAAARNIPHEDANMRQGGWQTTVGMDIAGRTMGLLGLGRLGAKVAGVAAALGMSLIAWSQNLTAERAREHGARLVSKDELFQQADVISVHLVLSERTRGLVGARELGLMKSTALLINTSRGPIVEEAALVAALRAGRIRGAGLDVYDTEPLPADHPLRSAPRTVLTPHLGYVSEDTYRVFYGESVANIEAWLKGAPTRVMTG